MISALSLFGIFRWFRGSLLAQIATGVIAMLGVWKINNHYVAKGAVKKVVAASKKEGKRRNANVRKIRRNINPNDAMRRLLREYAESGNR